LEASGSALRYGALPACAVADMSPARRSRSSAGFRAAESPISNRRGARFTPCVWLSHALRVGNPRYSRLEVCVTALARWPSNAGFQPDVSPISNRRRAGFAQCLGFSHALRVGNPRYSRLEVCVTALARPACSAGFQPAVSRISNPQTSVRSNDLQLNLLALALNSSRPAHSASGIWRV
jgi:hypothetical protein